MIHGTITENQKFVKQMKKINKKSTMGQDLCLVFGQKICSRLKIHILMLCIVCYLHMKIVVWKVWQVMEFWDYPMTNKHKTS